MEKITLSVTGLSCGGCVDAFIATAQSLPGVTDCEVTLVSDGVSRAVLSSDGSPSIRELETNLDDAGYSVACDRYGGES